MSRNLTHSQRVQLLQLAQLETDLRYRQGVRCRMIQHLWESGVTYQEIADALGAGATTVGEYIRRQVQRGWDGTDRRTKSYREQTQTDSR